jgi:hypothetical protein
VTLGGEGEGIEQNALYRIKGTDSQDR